jgi:hypothetical protein
MLGHERRSKVLAKLTNARCELEEALKRRVDGFRATLRKPIFRGFGAGKGSGRLGRVSEALGAFVATLASAPYQYWQMFPRTQTNPSAKFSRNLRP